MGRIIVKALADAKVMLQGESRSMELTSCYRAPACCSRARDAPPATASRAHSAAARLVFVQSTGTTGTNALATRLQ